MRLGPLWAWATVGTLCIAAWWLLRGVALPSGPEFTVCALRRFAGLPCPGCGLTRAFLALSRGDLEAAIHFHPLAPLLAMELCAAWLLFGAWALGRSVHVSRTNFNALLSAHAAALLALWLGRMATGTLPW
jgi:hypothetical protein